MKSLGQLAEKFLENTNEVPTYLPIFLNWMEVVGADLSAITEPFKVVISKGEQVLVLRVDRAYSLEIQHRSVEFLIMVNTYLGVDYFSQVKVMST